MAGKFKYTLDIHFNRNFSHNDEEINNIFAKFKDAFREMYPETKNYPWFPTILECFKYMTGRTKNIFISYDVFMICKVCASVPELKEKYGEALARVLE